MFVHGIFKNKLMTRFFTSRNLAVTKINSKKKFFKVYILALKYTKQNVHGHYNPGL
jgi:hypothetical protein